MLRVTRTRLVLGLLNHVSLLYLWTTPVGHDTSPAFGRGLASGRLARREEMGAWPPLISCRRVSLARAQAPRKSS